MTQREPPALGPDTSIEDVDLNEEETHYHGKRLTEETLDELRNRNLVPGRKSLTGGAVHSPRVQFRVSKNIQEEAIRRAEAEGKSVSALAREALEQYLRRQARNTARAIGSVRKPVAPAAEPRLV
ncbi:MAG: hypothetical protein ACRDMV_00770 [Streptosporangiales bacterium]